MKRAAAGTAYDGIPDIGVLYDLVPARVTLHHAAVRRLPALGGVARAPLTDSSLEQIVIAPT